MRVAFLDQYSDMGGAQWCLAEVLREAAQRGWSGELWSPGNGSLCDVARRLGFATRTLPLRRLGNGSKSLWDLIRYSADVSSGRRTFLRACADQRLDLIYVNGPRVLPHVVGAGTPVLFHSHSVLDKAYSRWIAKWSLRSRESGVLASSEFLAARLRPVLGTDRVQVIYNGVPDLGYRPVQDGRAIRVGIVGRIAPEKGQFDFLDAARRLAGAGLEFVIIGAEMFSACGYEEEVRKQGRVLGIEFAGWKEPNEIYRELDIVVVPSASHDANPRVLMEAMAAGVCVVAYRSGGIAEIVTDGENGLLTKPNPHALAAAIRTLAIDASLRQRLTTNGRKTYEQRFNVYRFRREVAEAMVASVSGAQPRATASHSEEPAEVCVRDKKRASA